MVWCMATQASVRPDRQHQGLHRPHDLSVYFDVDLLSPAAPPPQLCGWYFFCGEYGRTAPPALESLRFCCSAGFSGASLKAATGCSVAPSAAGIASTASRSSVAFAPDGGAMVGGRRCCPESQRRHSIGTESGSSARARAQCEAGRESTRSGLRDSMYLLGERSHSFQLFPPAYSIERISLQCDDSATIPDVGCFT